MYIDHGKSGVTGVPVDTGATAPISEEQVRSALEAAFRGRPGFDARGISIRTDGTTLALGGLVRSGAESMAALRAAWSIPQVTQVRNNICVFH